MGYLGGDRLPEATSFRLPSGFRLWLSFRSLLQIVFTSNPSYGPNLPVLFGVPISNVN